MRILWNFINFSLFGFECEMGMMHTYICMIQFLFRFVSIRSWIWLITKWNCPKCYTIHFIFYHYYSCRILCYNWDTFPTYCILDIYLFLWGIISHSGIWWYFRFIMHLEYFTKFDTLTRSIWCSSGYLMNKLKGNTVTLM